MGWKLKLLGVLNVMGWVVVVPVLVASLLHPFVNYKAWPGGFLLGGGSQEARLPDVREQPSAPRVQAPRPSAQAESSVPGLVGATPPAIGPGATTFTTGGGPIVPGLVIRPQVGGGLVEETIDAGTPNSGGIDVLTAPPLGAVVLPGATPSQTGTPAAASQLPPALPVRENPAPPIGAPARPQPPGRSTGPGPVDRPSPPGQAQDHPGKGPPRGDVSDADRGRSPRRGASRPAATAAPAAPAAPVTPSSQAAPSRPARPHRRPRPQPAAPAPAPQSTPEPAAPAPVVVPPAPPKPRRKEKEKAPKFFVGTRPQQPDVGDGGGGDGGGSDGPGGSGGPAGNGLGLGKGR